MINSKRMCLVNLMLAILPNSGAQKLKSAMLRWAGVKVGRDVEIFQGVKVQGIGEMELGDRCFIGHEALFLINEGSRIVVGDEAIVGTRCTVVTGFHPITPDGPRILSREGTTSTVRIGRGSAVLTGSTVLPGVTVGDMSIVAAGATVTKDVEPYTLVGGCPAKEIRRLTSLDDKSQFINKR
ncbi:MAG: acyltransferase [Bacteroidales bacterium]|nr:acyltransferase [Bacteroidales bacterium]